MSANKDIGARGTVVAHFVRKTIVGESRQK
jgi:hypothetical protein